MAASYLRTRRRSGPGEGQALAEFALVLPVLAVLLMSILQIGFLLFAQVGLTNAAREAARNASAIPIAMSGPAATAANTYFNRLTNSTSGFLTRNVGGYSPSHLVTTGTPRTSVCYFSYTDPSGAPAIMARVQIEYSHPLFIPLIAQILDGFDGANDEGFRLGVAEEIKVANPPLSTTDIGASGSPTCNP
jgi:Flp pilus assembly protein TadG